MAQVIMIIVFLALAIASGARAEDPIETWVREKVKTSPKHYLNNETALSAFVAEVKSVCSEHEIDPAFVMVNAFFESSFLPDVIGPRGERGILQVSKDNAIRMKCSFSTRRSGLECGVLMMKEALERCGSYEGALTSHATKGGKCYSKKDKIISMVEYRMSIVEGLR